MAKRSQKGSYLQKKKLARLRRRLTMFEGEFISDYVMSRIKPAKLDEEKSIERLVEGGKRKERQIVRKIVLRIFNNRIGAMALS
jgi:hypothetical protein